MLLDGPIGPKNAGTRARRRQDLDRMKAKARRVYGHARHPIKLANHLQFCSCHMCCNPRRIGEQPMQERRADAALAPDKLATAEA